MQFSAFNKAIAAVIGALLAVLSLVFKSDLGAYATLVPAIITGLIPVAVFLVPNVAAELADGGKFAGMETLAADIATGAVANVKATQPAAAK